MNHLRRPGPSRAERHGKAATVSRSGGVHEAHDLSDRFGSTWLAAWSRVQLGTLDVAGGQLAGARALPDEALDLSLAIHINRNMALCLVAFARLAFAEGDPGLAAVLAGAAAGLRQRAWPVLGRGEADLVAQVRQAQGAVRFDEIFAAGSRLSQREAVAAIRGRRRTGTRAPRPTAWPVPLVTDTAALTSCCPQARAIFGRSCHARPPAGINRRRTCGGDPGQRRRHPDDGRPGARPLRRLRQADRFLAVRGLCLLATGLVALPLASAIPPPSPCCSPRRSPPHHGLVFPGGLTSASCTEARPIPPQPTRGPRRPPRHMRRTHRHTTAVAA